MPRDATCLPEIFEVEGLVVRAFPGAYVAAFPQLSQSERRAIPAVVRRVYAAAARYLAEECLICGAPAPIEGRLLIAVETDGNQDIGCVCGVCVGLSAPIARAA